MLPSENIVPRKGRDRRDQRIRDAQHHRPIGPHDAVDAIGIVLRRVAQDDHVSQAGKPAWAAEIVDLRAVVLVHRSRSHRIFHAAQTAVRALRVVRVVFRLNLEALHVPFPIIPLQNARGNAVLSRIVVCGFRRHLVFAVFVTESGRLKRRKSTRSQDPKASETLRLPFPLRADSEDGPKGRKHLLSQTPRCTKWRGANHPRGRAHNLETAQHPTSRQSHSLPSRRRSGVHQRSLREGRGQSEASKRATRGERRRSFPGIEFTSPGPKKSIPKAAPDVDQLTQASARQRCTISRTLSADTRDAHLKAFKCASPYHWYSRHNALFFRHPKASDRLAGSGCRRSLTSLWRSAATSADRRRIWRRISGARAALEGGSGPRAATAAAAESQAQREGKEGSCSSAASAGRPRARPLRAQPHPLRRLCIDVRRPGAFFFSFVWRMPWGISRGGSAGASVGSLEGHLFGGAGGGLLVDLLRAPGHPADRWPLLLGLHLLLEQVLRAAGYRHPARSRSAAAQLDAARLPPRVRGHHGLGMGRLHHVPVHHRTALQHWRTYR
eukprot:scaffold1023_cov313-Pinguiococcus_pyrenoidosus.AAC.25